MSGRVFCYRNAVLEVENLYHTRRVGGGGIIQVRCYSFLYVGWIAGGNLALKYHNHHADPDEYVHRVYDPVTGGDVLYEVLLREQFPVFAEVLDELEVVRGGRGGVGVRPRGVLVDFVVLGVAAALRAAGAGGVDKCPYKGG